MTNSHVFLQGETALMGVIKTLVHVLSACIRKHGLSFVQSCLLGLEGCATLMRARPCRVNVIGVSRTRQRWPINIGLPVRKLSQACVSARCTLIRANCWPVDLLSHSVFLQVEGAIIDEADLFGHARAFDHCILARSGHHTYLRIIGRIPSSTTQTPFLFCQRGLCLISLQLDCSAADVLKDLD